MKNKRLTIALSIIGLAGYMYAVNERPEYPRPDFERSEWINLNGPWTYIIDYTDTGLEKGYPSSTGFEEIINVPFCPESELSGVNNKDFINNIWYQKTVNIPEEWNDKDVMLNFGAVYDKAEVYVNGQLAARHSGGSTPFSINISPYNEAGNPVNIVVKASSDVRSGLQPAGKQSRKYDSNGCNYTRTTGIWQTVWMEPVAKCGLIKANINPDIVQQMIVVTPEFNIPDRNCTLSVVLRDGEKSVSNVSVPAASGVPIVLPVKRMKLWNLDNPFLYDIDYVITDSKGNKIDEVKSYVGCRQVEICGNQIYLNGEPCYQRLVLDQGFYPDGIWTAPSDEALKNDILLSKAAGFNGARLHQKVFEPRYHYWADKLGYLTWGEAPSWGFDANNPLAESKFVNEWAEIVERDKNHPSIIIWTPMNEEWWPDTDNYPRFVAKVYDLTKTIDPSRPVNDASGGCHVKTNIWTVHTYEQNPDLLAKSIYDPSKEGGYKDKFMQLNHGRGVTVRNEGFNNASSADYPFPQYDGEMPFIVDEFGGIKWNPQEISANSSWGYGDTPKTEQEFLERLEGQVDALMSLEDNIAGYCYTQLTDVEQECNGLYYYDRTPKFKTEQLNKIFSKQPIKNDEKK